jgi:putative lipoprotein
VREDLRIVFFVTCLGIALLARCSGRREAEPPDARANSSSVALSAVTVDSGRARGPAGGAPVPEEDSARPFRGMVVLGHGAHSFRECGAVGDLVVVDSTSGELESAYAGLASDAREPVYVELIGRSGPPPSEDRGAGYAGWLVALELRRASPQGESFGCERQPLDALLLARGNEPFWNVTVSRTRILYQDPEHLDGIVFPPVPPELLGGRRLYRSERAGVDEPGDILIDAEPKPCRDSMSGEYFHMSAEVRLDGRVLRGCAALGA